MKSALFFVIIALNFMLAAVAGAQQQIGKEQVTVARFNKMASDTDWKVRTSNGGAKQKWLLHQVKVTKIAERLKAGESELILERSRRFSKSTRGKTGLYGCPTRGCLRLSPSLVPDRQGRPRSFPKFVWRSEGNG